MANWTPLRTLLEGVDLLTLSWSELDSLVDGLPPSAYKHAAFWSGKRSAWAGFHAIDVQVQQSVTFARLDSGPVKRETPATHGASARQAASTAADLVLVGCVKQKLARACRAKDLYTSDLFRKERAYAEASGGPWFILSAEHGLVDPEELLAPYELRLSETSVDYRTAWGRGVVNRLIDLSGPLQGKSIEIHAGVAYVEPIRDLLRKEGACVVEPLAGLSFGRRLAWYNAGPATTNEGIDGLPRPTIDSARYVLALRDQSSAQSTVDFQSAEGVGLRFPGLYSWWVDAEGANDLTMGIGHAVRPGLIYAGLAGATRERSGKRSSNTLWLRINGMHLGGRHEFSTLRLTLGSALASALGWGEIDELALTKWMHRHLRVVTIPVSDADSLGSIETAVLKELDPPLNLSKVPKTDLRRQLTVLRGRYSKRRQNR